MRVLRCSRLFLLVFLIVAVPLTSFAGVFISVAIAPPPLPVYEQPWCPGPGYIWTPGYWAYGPDGYFWVPGTWVLAPEVGYLWTPGYWGWGGYAYIWNAGYWGPQVGFYGGVNYGYGYYGNGYEGGYWHGRDFYYNRAVNRVNVTNIHNTYNTTVNNVTVNRVSYNGGHGGIKHIPMLRRKRPCESGTLLQRRCRLEHEQMARTDRSQWASVNHGRPAVAATPKPTAFHGAGVVTAKNAPVTNNPAVRAPQSNNENRANNSRPNNGNVPRPPERANAGHPSTEAQRSTTANNVPHPNNAVPHPPTRENGSRPNTAAAPHTNNPTVAHNSGHASPAEPARQAPHPPAHVNQGEPASHGKNAANVPRPPARETAPRPNNAKAPRPENSTVAHNMGHSLRPKRTVRRLTRQSARTNRLRT